MMTTEDESFFIESFFETLFDEKPTEEDQAQFFDILGEK